MSTAVYADGLMTRLGIRERLRAGTIHLGLCIVAASACLAMIFLVWYPSPLAESQGVDELVLLMLGVDVVLGPVLTMCVFNRGKKSLRMDLGVIALLQLCALSYGMGTIFKGRPVLIAFNTDRFDVVAANEVDEASLAKAIAAGKPGLSYFGPRTVVAYQPSDHKEHQSLILSSLSGGADIPQLPHLQVPYDEGRAVAAKAEKPISMLKTVSGLPNADWAALIASTHLPESSIGWLPLKTRKGEGAVLMELGTGRILSIHLMKAFG